MVKRRMNTAEHKDYLYTAYDRYIENIRTCLDLFKYKFMHPSDISYKGYKYNWDIDNVYLQSIRDDRLALGRSIKENGMYYPFIIDSNNVIIEGNHRLWALQEIKVPSSQKYLCIYMDERVFDRPFDISPQWTSPQEVYLPFEQLSKKMSSLEIQTKMDAGLIEFTDDIKIVKIKTTDKALFCDYVIQFGCWLSYPMYEYENRLKQKFKPSLIISNEPAFNRWLRHGNNI